MTPMVAQVGADPSGAAFAGLVVMIVVLLIGSALTSGFLAGLILLIIYLVKRSAKPTTLAVPHCGVLIRPYQALPTDAMRDAFAVRHAVFVVEQGITVVPDQDGKDESCEHVLAYDEGQVIGTARLIWIEVDGREQIKVGRVAVLAEHRGRGVGRHIILAVNRLLDERGLPGVMSAQAELADWYAALGWVREGEVYVEAGIDHVKMRYTPGNTATSTLH